MNLNSLNKHVQSYTLIVQSPEDSFDVLLTKRLQYNGKMLWAIQLGNDSFLDKESLMFTLKPSNSEIDEEYIKTHRYETIEEAMLYFEKFLKFDFNNIEDLDESIKKTLCRRQKYIIDRLIPDLI